MTQVVWKYELYPGESRHIELPVNAKPLTVGVSRGFAVMWCLVDPEENNTEIRFFSSMDTGDKFMASDAEYIGTFTLDNIRIFHVFEVSE